MLITYMALIDCQKVTLFCDEKNTSNDEKNTSRTPPKRRGKYVFDEKTLRDSLKYCTFAPWKRTVKT